MMLNTSKLYIVIDNINVGYSFDTGLPDEVFTTKESADEYAKHMNKESAKLKLLGNNPVYKAVPLNDRLYNVIQNARDEGAHNANNENGMSF